MENKKVLFVAVNFFCPEYLDGGNKIIYNLLSCINKEQQFQAHFLSLYNGEMKEEQKHSFDNIQVTPNDSPPNKLIFKFKKALNWLFLRQPRVKLPKSYSRALAKKIIKLSLNFDSIHLTSLTLASIADHLPKSVLEKTILSAVDCYSMYIERKLENETSKIKRIFGKMELSRANAFEKAYYPKFQSVIFVSDVDRAYALKVFKIPDNLEAIPLGVDANYFSPGNPELEEEKTIIFTGNMTYPPNKDASLFLLREVYPLIKMKKPQIKLILAGSNPSAELLEYSSDLIVITGRVPDLRTYIRQSALFVCPLRFGAGMKYKILEAMALEKVILCSELSVDGIQNENIDSCHVLKNLNPELWANKIIELLEVRQRSGRPRHIKGRQIIKDFYSWTAMKRKYTALYR